MNEGLMKSLEESANIVAMFSGIKRQFMDAGWSEPMAEAMTVEMLRAASKAYESGAA